MAGDAASSWDGAGALMMTIFGRIGANEPASS